MQKANAEKWKQLKDEAASEQLAKARQKTANAVANNAMKLERAKELALDRIIKVLESMPDTTATNVREYAQRDGKRQTVEYNLLELVTALEKMTKGEDSKTGSDTVQVVIDV